MLEGDGAGNVLGDPLKFKSKFPWKMMHNSLNWKTEEWDEQQHRQVVNRHFPNQFCCQFDQFNESPWPKFLRYAWQSVLESSLALSHCGTCYPASQENKSLGQRHESEESFTWGWWCLVFQQCANNSKKKGPSLSTAHESLHACSEILFSISLYTYTKYIRCALLRLNAHRIYLIGNAWFDLMCLFIRKNE